MIKIRKRDGSLEEVKFDKISSRIRKQTYGLDPRAVDPIEVAQKVIAGIYDGVSTEELDNLAAETAASLTSVHPDYSILAARIAITRLYKNTEKGFSETVRKLHAYINPRTGEPAGLVSDELRALVETHGRELDSMVVRDRDMNFDYFGFKTLERSYLLKMDGKPVETPQHLYMRVAAGIWNDNLEMVRKTYDMLSQGLITHATPTLFNAGTRNSQLSSCFLLDLHEDSIAGIFKTLSDCALISKNAGGIGVNIHKMRAKGSYIKGTFGTSNGIVPFLRIFNETARAVDQGGGKRKGSIAVYLEPWHADIYEFLDLRKNHGKEEMRARDLFLALWTPDLFMRRVKDDAEWSLFSPDEAPGLDECFDDRDNPAFSELYTRYEREGRARRTVRARALWAKILESQIETGTPYMLYKDAANAKSNQKNLGTIKSSNLCTEIIEFTSPGETAVCNLASIALPRMVTTIDGQLLHSDKRQRHFDHQKLYEAAYQATLNLNRVIDINYYPTPETRRSNLRHRPIGIGVQGLADVFALLGHAFDSDEARTLNREIFETIYFGALSASKDLAARDGAYETFAGSPASQGLLQFDLWDAAPSDLSGRWDWASLKREIREKGLRNSLLLAPMPTASTAQILGNNECFEPFTSNLYKRNTLSGEYVLVNKHLVRDLVDLGLWNENLRLKLIHANGSVQDIPEIPDSLKSTYKTVWEIKQKVVMDMARDRGLFICQSQSMNLFMAEVTIGKLNSAHFYAWERGLKTGMYYLRTRPKAEAIKGLGVQSAAAKPEPVAMAAAAAGAVPEAKAGEAIACSLDNPESCQACGS